VLFTSCQTGQPISVGYVPRSSQTALLFVCAAFTFTTNERPIKSTCSRSISATTCILLSANTFVIVSLFRYFFNVLCLDSPNFTLQPRRKQQSLFANSTLSSQRAYRPPVVTTQND
jgi:hypothetical protein